MEPTLRPPRTIGRLPLLATGVLLLVAAMWGGLLRLGWPWPNIGPAAVVHHGPLMIGGFLGTVISLERAVALGRWWAYAGPVTAAVGAACLLTDLPPVVPQTLQLAASLMLVGVFIVIVVRQPAMFTVTMALGAAAWAVGNARWLAGHPIPDAVPWWIGFLVLTIVGERLELSRFLPRSTGKQAAFVAAAGLYLLGVVLGIIWPGLGWAIAGAGMLALAAWLGAYDLARQTVRQRGDTRFVAVCLLIGYFWLAVGGGLAMYQIARSLDQPHAAWLHAAPMAGPAYDAVLHAVLLGFVFSMIFGHALIIFPAVLGVRMIYSPRFYLHLILLEASVGLRVVGDVAGETGLRQWAGLLNALAIILFLAQTLASIRRRPARPRPGPAAAGGRTIRLASSAPPTAPRAAGHLR